MADTEVLEEEQSEDSVFDPKKAGLSRAAMSQERDDGSGVLLSDTVVIHPNRPLKDLRSPGTQAFVASDKETGDEMLALLCGRSIVPRTTDIANYRNIGNPALLRLQNAGIVHWPKEDRHYLAMLFEKPLGGRIVDDMDKEFEPFPEGKLVTNLIAPIVSVLDEFYLLDMVHGAVNLNNIFVSGSHENSQVVLGECLSSPHSFTQHALFEPVTRAIADPIARGPGIIRDDLYSFGVCVAILARGHNLLAGLSEEEVIKAKIEKGTYGALVGTERLPGGITEFLRGVLIDDAQQRWDIEEVKKWVEGRRLSPKQPKMEPKATRPWLFQGKKHIYLRTLANELAKDPKEAADVVLDDQFSHWLTRNFQDKALNQHFEIAVGSEAEKGTSGMNRQKLVSQVCMALDPPAPVRYKQYAFQPKGFGTALARAMGRDEDIQVYAELLNGQFFNFWFSMQIDLSPDAATVSSQIEQCRNYATQKLPGYGMERVVYTLCKEAPCLSPVLRDYFVTNPGDLLLALENLVKKGHNPDMLLDRHMVAFISVREQKMIDPHLGLVVSQEKGNRIEGVLRTLAAIQRRFRIGPVPAVGNYIIGKLGPAIDRVHDRDLRKKMLAAVQRYTDDGRLSNILNIVNDPAVIRDDMVRFTNARREYVLLSVEHAKLKQKLGRKNILGKGTGQQVAMVISSLLSTLLIMGFVLLHFLT